MRTNPVADDPRHYQARDGRILPVLGAHELGVRVGMGCAVCDLVPKRGIATKFSIGQKVEWTYGADGTSHGTVLQVARSRVQVQRIFLRRGKSQKVPPAIWKRALDLRPEGRSAS